MSSVQSFPGTLIIEAGGALVFGGVQQASLLSVNAQGLVVVGGSLPATAFPLLAPDGSSAVPSYAFSAEPGTGFFRAGVGIIRMSGNGSSALQLYNTGALQGMDVLSDTGIIRFGAVPDLVMTRDAANIMALRNSVNAQIFRLYNTFTDAANYERLTLSWATNVLTIKTENAGTGLARALVFGAGATSVLGFYGQAGSAQSTGYGTPTGGAKLINFPGATATLAQTSGALAQLLLDLKSYGLLGA